MQSMHQVVLDEAFAVMVGRVQDASILPRVFSEEDLQARHECK